MFISDRLSNMIYHLFCIFTFYVFSFRLNKFPPIFIKSPIPHKKNYCIIKNDLWQTIGSNKCSSENYKFIKSYNELFFRSIQMKYKRNSFR